MVAPDRVGRIQEVFGLRGFTLADNQLPIRFVLCHPKFSFIVDTSPRRRMSTTSSRCITPSGSSFRIPIATSSRGQRSNVAEADGRGLPAPRSRRVLVVAW